MFEQVGPKRLYSREDTLRWLTWMARQLGSNNQTIFIIEQMQPSWLDRPIERIAYLLTSRLLAAASILLVFVVGSVLVSQTIHWDTLLNRILIGGLLAALLDGLRWAKRSTSTTLTTRMLLWERLITLLIFIAALALYEIHWGLEYLSTGIAWGILIGLMLGVRTAGRRCNQDIQLAEGVGWSWKKGLPWTLFGCAVGVFLGVIFEMLPKANSICSPLFE